MVHVGLDNSHIPTDTRNTFIKKKNQTMIFWNWICFVLFIIVSLVTKVGGRRCYVSESFLRDGISHAFYYGGHTYYISKNSYVNDVDSEAKCNSICGTLAMIDYKEEMNALIGLVEDLKSAPCFLIRGNNKGQEKPNDLVIGDGPEPVPFVSWAKDQPNGFHVGQRCLFLEDGYDGMLDMPCTKGPWECRFLCEVF
ncbi:unnamed protein product [Lymnaea stagnalis]|uniref:C-type lectin domain-containing protein n=1 Tax=Lymnaea stagnalis TaxID=6523 RepID=A0AAV2HUV3_LYMST